jgi:hypothetical protein
MVAPEKKTSEEQIVPKGGARKSAIGRGTKQPMLRCAFALRDFRNSPALGPKPMGLRISALFERLFDLVEENENFSLSGAFQSPSQRVI